MSAVPPSPLLKRVPPGAWTAAAWCAGTVFTFLIRMRLPGEGGASVRVGVLFSRWDGRATLMVATVLTLIGSGLLRRRPLTALVLMLAGSVFGTVPLSVGAIELPQFLAVDVALWFIAATGRRRTSHTAAVLTFATLAAYLAFRLLSGWIIGTSTELAVAMTAAIAWLVGNSTHQAREHAEDLRSQAASQAVTTERLRIARELHDAVAHSIGIVALQAGAARRVIDTQPVRARDALREVEISSRETLSGLRRMLGALRQAESEAAPLHEMPGLADLDRLAESTTAAGVRVDVRWRGERRPLPAEVDLSAFRVIQEAVTNVVRHAETRSCTVSIDYQDEDLAIEVADGGRGHGGDPDTGYGLLGMRERVALLHGDFSAGPLPEGGFLVTVRLPLPAGVT